MSCSLIAVWAPTAVLRLWLFLLVLWLILRYSPVRCGIMAGSTTRLAPPSWKGLAPSSMSNPVQALYYLMLHPDLPVTPSMHTVFRSANPLTLLCWVRWRCPCQCTPHKAASPKHWLLPVMRGPIAPVDTVLSSTIATKCPRPPLNNLVPFMVFHICLNSRTSAAFRCSHNTSLIYEMDWLYVGWATYGIDSLQTCATNKQCGY